MKGISRILLLGGVAAAAFVALLAALFLLMPGAGEDTAQAQGGTFVEQLIDMFTGTIVSSAR